MYLVRLHNVSRGSWQPELWYKDPDSASLEPDVLGSRSEPDPGRASWQPELWLGGPASFSLERHFLGSLPEFDSRQPISLPSGNASPPTAELEIPETYGFEAACAGVFPQSANNRPTIYDLGSGTHRQSLR